MKEKHLTIEPENSTESQGEGNLKRSSQKTSKQQ